MELDGKRTDESVTEMNNLEARISGTDFSASLNSNVVSLRPVKMNYISWNCRGLGNSWSVRVLGDLVKSSNPDFLFLSETKVGSNRIEEVCRILRFSKFFAVDSGGSASGLANF